MGTVSHSPRVPILENLVFGNKHFALSWFLLHRSQTYTTKYCRICLLLRFVKIGKRWHNLSFSVYFLNMYKSYAFKDGGRGPWGTILKWSSCWILLTGGGRTIFLNIQIFDSLRLERGEKRPMGKTNRLDSLLTSPPTVGGSIWGE